MFTKLFQTYQQHIHKIWRFNHCASVTPHKRGVIVAWYSGLSECHRQQSVYVMYTANGSTSKPIRIGDSTGNPVLFNNGNDAYILWSEFDDAKAYAIESVVDKWKYCHIYVAKVNVDANNEVCIGSPSRIFMSAHNLLGRCAPMIIDNTAILPLYNEMFNKCVIATLSLDDMKIINKTDACYNIQPALWYQDGNYHIISRNFRSSNIFAKSSYSYDLINWSEPTETIIKNNNSSLCVVKWGNTHYMIWNDTSGRVRTNLSIGSIEIVEFKTFGVKIPVVKKLFQISEYGAYPSACVDRYNQLHVVFTTKNREIKHVIWNRNGFKSKSAESQRSERRPRRRWWRR